MSRKPKQSMYKKFSVKDTIVILLSLIALAALVYMVNRSKDRTRMEQDQLAATGNFSIDEKNDLLSVAISALSINEVNQAGWIELYNSGRNNITLDNCYITVNGEKKFTFQPTDLMKGNEILVIEGLGQLGTSDHDIIGLYDGKGKNLKSMMISSLTKEESYGCRSDGGIDYCFLTSSKGESNSESNVIYKSILTYSVPGGFYTESFPLELTAGDNMSIFYTLDGTEPTVESTRYEGPILIENKSGSNMKYAIADGIEYLYSYQPASISMGMVVRAIAVDSSGKIRESKTQSYYVGLKNASDIRNIAVLSITTSPENLFDYFDGIYVSGRSREDVIARGGQSGSYANYLNGWKREVFVEYFEPQKDKTFEGNMTISIINDYSITLPQKSLLLEAKGGAFAGSSLIEYYNDGNNHFVVQTNKRDNKYKIREYLAGELLANTTVGTPDIAPCIVFINGEYWGGYMLRAQYDEQYIEKHYGVDKEDVLIAENGSVITDQKYQKELDELYSFLTTQDLMEDENYTWVKANMDVQNFLEYFCANMYLANADYNLDQPVMWRTKSEQGTEYKDGRWRFLMPKLDNTMDNETTGQVTKSSINTYLRPGVSSDKILKSLLRNDEFKNQLRAVMTKMEEDVFTNERVESAITDISSDMKRMADMSYKRFNSNLGVSYAKEVEKIMNFFEQRGKYILLYTDEVINLGGISNVIGDAVSE